VAAAAVPQAASRRKTTTPNRQATRGIVTIRKANIPPWGVRVVQKTAATTITRLTSEINALEQSTDNFGLGLSGHHCQHNALVGVHRGAYSGRGGVTRS
jgi:hypothetical protein